MQVLSHYDVKRLITSLAHSKRKNNSILVSKHKKILRKKCSTENTKATKIRIRFNMQILLSEQNIGSSFIYWTSLYCFLSETFQGSIQKLRLKQTGALKNVPVIRLSKRQNQQYQEVKWQQIHCIRIFVYYFSYVAGRDCLNIVKEKYFLDQGVP